MAIKNTEKDPNLEWLMGGDPDAIRQQEQKGQNQLVDSEQLPRKSNPYHDESAEEVYERWGIEIIGDTEGDDLFYDVRLPDGWKKEPTDHPMWTKLVDSEGNIKAKIFYKAAFYDRDAFININD